MIKFGKNTVQSEKYMKLAEAYEALGKQISDKNMEIREASYENEPALRNQANELIAKQKAMQPELYKEFFRMFNKKYVKISDLYGRGYSYYYFDGIKITKRRSDKLGSCNDVTLNGQRYSVNNDKCKAIHYTSFADSIAQGKMYSFTSYMIFETYYKVTEITKAKFNELYKKAISSEQLELVRKAAGYELAYACPSDDLKKTDKYKELTNFVKTAKLRENVAKLRLIVLTLEDNKKRKLAELKDKNVKVVIAAAFDHLIKQNNAKIEKNEKEIAKRCGKSK